MATARATFIGDPAAAPAVFIAESPPPCCAGTWAGMLRGSVANVDPNAVAVAIYSHTDVWYIQPYENSLVLPDAAGRFATALRGGDAYAALVVSRHASPAPLLVALPEVDGTQTKARCIAPDSQRRIQFADRTWVVKSAPLIPAGPGPNLWNDGPESVWVDAAGLHLRIVQRDGLWYGAEVFSEEYCSYGRYRFEVDASVDHLDAGAIFAGFLYDDNGSEMDIEWSRWGDATNPFNAQFVVHPDQIQPLALALDGGAVAHELTWSPGGADFTARRAGANAGQSPLASWSVRDAVPNPEFTRWRFNLWLQGGAAPAGLAEIEIVVRSFELDTPTDIASQGTPDLGRLEVATPVRHGSIRYQLAIPTAGRVAVTLFDARGRKIAPLFDAVLPAGSHPLAAAMVPRAAPGIYFLRATGPGLQTGRKIVFLP